MKLLTYEDRRGGPRLGALGHDDDGRILDLQRGAEELGMSESARASLASMLDLIEAGSAGLAAAREILEAGQHPAAGDWARIDGTAVTWHPPIPEPPQLRDCLLFEEHLLNAFAMLRKTRAEQEADPEAALEEFEERGLYRIPEVWYQQPVYYKVNRFSFIGHGQDIVWPDYSERLDFELEFACVLNSRTKDVSAEQARGRIFGYTIYNDVSARDVQSAEMQAQLGPSKGKDFDTGNVLGPCIVTADEVDPADMTMIARINGEQWCRGNSGSAYWTFPQVIAHASRCETLVPGEMFGSGTVGGGCGLELGRYLSPGDVIELEVSGIGTLRNRVVRPGHAGSGS